jgi:SAM-dependent methyltransferase
MIDAYESFGKKLKARFTLSLIRRHCRGDSLLEIGPGGGGFLRQARKRYRVHAAEFNPAQVAHLRALGIDCRRGPFADTFSGETFDVIYLCDVLSHFFDPVAELSAMRVMLNPGGIVVLETGNNGDLDRRHYRSIDRWQYPDHLFFFSEKSLEHLAKASGFSIASKHAYSRVVEMLLDRKLKPAKGAAKGTRSVPSTPTVKRRLIKTAMSAKHTVDYFLIYRLGAFLPKPGRPQTLIAVLTIR